MPRPRKTGSRQTGQYRALSSNDGAGVVLMAVALLAILSFSNPTTEIIPEYDLTENPFGTLPNDQYYMGFDTGECDDFLSASPSGPNDEDLDGVANEQDPSCIILSDSDMNGICDSRLYAGARTESLADYEIDFNNPCSGWE